VGHQYPKDCGACAETPSRSPPTCEKQLASMACSASYGTRECLTCGKRIEQMKQRNNSEKDARLACGKLFAMACGACGPFGTVRLGQQGYKEAWKDDFTGNDIDRNKWAFYTGVVHSAELQAFTNREANANVSDGKLIITARREDYAGRHFTSARLVSKESWTYGKFCVRAKMSSLGVPGTWPALWMLPVAETYGAWPKSGEIEILENAGRENGLVHGVVSTGAYNHMQNSSRMGTTDVDVTKFHNYCIEWLEDRIIWAVDEAVYYIFPKASSRPDKWPFNTPFNLILSYSVGGRGGGPKAVDEAKFRRGQSMQILWVRVWQKK